MTDPSPAIPARLARTMVELHGLAGEDWLRRLPTLIADCARRWSLTVASPFEDVGYSYVAPARRDDGAPAVLKVAFPTDESTCEREALRVFAGRGSVQLLEADPDRGALLLERLEPGTQLAAIVDDEQATAIAAQVMRELWRPAPPDHPFPTIADWGRGLQRLRERFDGGTGPLPSALVERAEGLYSQLIESIAEPVLLHGDFHHFNIIAAQRRPWLTIDPKGVVGEPAYEVGAFLHNPFPDPRMVPHLDRLLARRLDVLADELAIDRARLRAWGLYHCMLSAWWSIEDEGCGWESAITYAEALASIRP